MDLNKKFRNNIRKLYLYWFFHAFIFAYVIERLYWAERGMSVQDVVYVEIIYALSVALLEVLSGYISDRWSRKWILVIGSVFTCLEFLVFLLATTFWHFVLAILFAAIAGAILSGSSNAFVYDTLLELGEQEHFEKIIGRIRFVKYVAATIAALLGSIVATTYDLWTNYWSSLISVLVALGISFSFIDPSIRSEDQSDEEDKQPLKQAIAFLYQYRNVQFVLIYGMVIGVCLVYLEEFWQLYVEWIGIPILFFGLVSATNMFSSGLSGLISYRLKERFSYKGIFSMILLLFTIGLLLMSVVQHPVGVLFLLIAFMTAGTAEPLISGYLHHRTSSEMRATVESIYSLIVRVAIAGVGFVFGAVADQFGIQYGFLFLGILSFGSMIVYHIFAKKVLE